MCPGTNAKSLKSTDEQSPLITSIVTTNHHMYPISRWWSDSFQQTRMTRMTGMTGMVGGAVSEDQHQVFPFIDLGKL